MTTWRDKMGKASFRGVPFYVDTSERGGGRRGVLHEYPFKDTPFAEDLGRKARTFPVEGHVIGASYMDARDLLIQALEGEGPGPLVHPYYGTRQCVVSDFRVRESSDEGGLARFAITFVETDTANLEPSANVDTLAAAQSSADAANQASYDFFTSQFKIAQQPTWTLAPISNMVQAASSKVYGTLAPFVSDAQQLASLKSQADAIGGNATALLLTPANLISSLSSFVSTIQGLPLTSAGLTALLTAYNFDAFDRPPATTPTRIQQQANFDAAQRLFQQTVVIQAARAAPTVAWDSYEDAINARGSITDLIDSQMETVNDDAYPYFVQLRADLCKAVPGGTSDLPHLVQYTPPANTPSLVLAYRLYGNLDSEADILNRNKVFNPAFIPGGRPLQVLSDE